MNYKNLFKKGQSLPLNTIVIAILVIIVLLVIIVFFTSQLGESGKAIEGQSITQCSPSNPALSTLGYTKVSYFEDLTDSENTDCSEGFKPAIGVAKCCVIEKIPK